MQKLRSTLLSVMWLHMESKLTRAEERPNEEDRLENLDHDCYWFWEGGVTEECSKEAARCGRRWRTRSMEKRES